MREVSATGACAAAAASRMAATTSAASLGDTVGPAGTRRRPVALAKSQSTKDGTAPSSGRPSASMTSVGPAVGEAGTVPGASCA